jgi:putative tricarboxylic transport membrane protein
MGFGQGLSSFPSNPKSLGTGRKYVRREYPSGDLNLPFGIFVSLLRIPFRILFPIILLVCLVGAYSINADTLELFILLIFGVFGYVLRKLDYDIAPFLLAMIIGPMIEMAFRQALMRSAGSFSIFWKSPISMILLTLSCLLFLWNTYRSLRPAKASWKKVLEQA